MATHERKKKSEKSPVCPAWYTVIWLCAVSFLTVPSTGTVLSVSCALDTLVKYLQGYISLEVTLWCLGKSNDTNAKGSLSSSPNPTAQGQFLLLSTTKYSGYCQALEQKCMRKALTRRMIQLPPWYMTLLPKACSRNNHTFHRISCGRFPFGFVDQTIV